jgi:hypothetical protein
MDCKGMDKKYVRYEAAADQFIGRILAMLDVNSPNFAVLAPHFDLIDNEVLQAVKDCFPNAADSLNSVLVNCLASLIFHQDYFHRVLPQNHKLLQCVVFTQGYALRLRHRVALSFPGDKVSPSGIPAHVGVMVRIERLEEESKALPERLKQIFHAELEQRAFDAGQMTRDHVQGMLNGMLDRVCGEMRGIVAPLQGNVPARQVEEAERAVPNAEFRTWLVDGTVRRAPPDFKFNTSITAGTLFQLYCRGDTSKQIGPFRKLQSIDVGDVKQRKRLSDMHSLMSPVRDALKAQKRWKSAPTMEEVNRMWEEGCKVIAPAPKTNKGVKRRINQLSWTSQLNEFRKRSKAEVASDSED